MQMMVPRFLEVSIDSLTREQEKFRSQMKQAFGLTPFGGLDDQVKRNMELFQRAFTMFAPFARRDAQAAASAEPEKAPRSAGELDELKRQLADMQKRLERLSDDGKKDG
jgi:polyhydroxyalkanoate synthesis regulator protein